MRYFIHDPEENETLFFDDKEQWQKAMDDYDFAGKYSDDGWSEEVTSVIAGQIKDGDKYDPEKHEEYDFYYDRHTHRAEQCHIRERPDELDESGCDSEGIFWNEHWAYICNYRFEAIEPEILSINNKETP